MTKADERAAFIEGRTRKNMAYEAGTAALSLPGVKLGLAHKKDRNRHANAVGLNWDAGQELKRREAGREKHTAKAREARSLKTLKALDGGTLDDFSVAMGDKPEVISGAHVDEARDVLKETAEAIKLTAHLVASSYFADKKMWDTLADAYQLTTATPDADTVTMAQAAAAKTTALEINNVVAQALALQVGYVANLNGTTPKERATARQLIPVVLDMNSPDRAATMPTAAGLFARGRKVEIAMATERAGKAAAVEIAALQKTLDRAPREYAQERLTRWKKETQPGLLEQIAALQVTVQAGAKAATAR